MPANLQQVFDTIGQLGARVRERADERSRQENAAISLLTEQANAPEALALAVGDAATAVPGLRCALPAHEDIGAAYSPGTGAECRKVLAVDGSQATPDRHEEILFGLINIGAVSMEAGSGEAPQVDVETRLLFGDSLHPGGGPMISDGEIALLRDSMERASLLQHAESVEPAAALLDGPLELWGSKDIADTGAYERALESYLKDLGRLHDRGWIVAGYVDKPAADLVVRLLELSQANAEDRHALRSHRPFALVSDRDVFARLLSPGTRSAIFGLHSASRSRYLGPLALHFFYLNVGSERQPSIARVEVPAWIATDKAKLEALQRTLLSQCAMLGARPYPYILHRAHEEARITSAEREELKLRLLLEVRRAGVEPEFVSGKSFAKRAGQPVGGF